MNETITPIQNFTNAVLMVSVAFPAIWIGLQVFNKCDGLEMYYLAQTCELGLTQPLLFVNILFFINVCVLFWVISLFLDSTWLIDPYWTIIPPMIGIFYHYHPNSHGNPVRAWVCLGLTFIWSIRLTHSYFRREKYYFGLREDWRFTNMKIANPKSWWWLSFFAAFLSQQPMLVGLTLPLWAVNLHPTDVPFTLDFGIIDIIATMGCIAGIIIAYIADSQLSAFMEENENRLKEGRKKVILLNTGIWRYSQHPNYFGEQLWWWSLAVFSFSVRQPWVFIGTAFNTAIMVEVTKMTDQRMLSDVKRAHQYKHYQECTSSWIPWQPRLPKKFI